MNKLKMKSLMNGGEAVKKQILAGRVSEAMTFSQKVLALTARIPRGKVATYSGLAAQLGCGAPRAVGNALNQNPYAPQVPCHRVVGGDGSLTGFALGLPTKRKMLLAEGVKFNGEKVATQSMIARVPGGR